MRAEVEEVARPKGRHDAERLGGASRPRGGRGDARWPGCRSSARGRAAPDASAELPLATYAHFADRDPLTAVVLERMLAGVSTHRYRRTREPVGAVMMLDGIELKGRTSVVALGITTDGAKIPLGPWEGSSENATEATACCPIWSSAASTPGRGCSS